MFRNTCRACCLRYRVTALALVTKFAHSCTFNMPRRLQYRVNAAARRVLESDSDGVFGMVAVVADTTDAVSYRTTNMPDVGLLLLLVAVSAAVCMGDSVLLRAFDDGALLNVSRFAIVSTHDMYPSLYLSTTRTSLEGTSLYLDNSDAGSTGKYSVVTLFATNRERALSHALNNLCYSLAFDARYYSHLPRLYRSGAGGGLLVYTALSPRIDAIEHQFSAGIQNVYAGSAFFANNFSFLTQRSLLDTDGCNLFDCEFGCNPTCLYVRGAAAVPFFDGNHTSPWLRVRIDVANASASMTVTGVDDERQYAAHRFDFALPTPPSYGIGIGVTRASAWFRRLVISTACPLPPSPATTTVQTTARPSVQPTSLPVTREPTNAPSREPTNVPTTTTTTTPEPSVHFMFTTTSSGVAPLVTQSRVRRRGFAFVTISIVICACTATTIAMLHRTSRKRYREEMQLRTLAAVSSAEQESRRENAHRHDYSIVDERLEEALRSSTRKHSSITRRRRRRYKPEEIAYVVELSDEEEEDEAVSRVANSSSLSAGARKRQP